MKRSELILKLMSKHPHLSQSEIENMVLLFFSEITQAMKDDKKVSLRSFGTFTAKKRAARQARNPKNGEIVHVEEKKAPVFKFGKSLHHLLND